MNILVTGANGFVGKTLCKLLLKDNNKVLAIVRSSWTHQYRNLIVHRIDSLTKDFDLSAQLKQIDCVVHLAARAHVSNKITSDSLQQFREVNVNAATLLLKQAASMRVKRFLYVSSIGVFGDFSETPFNEESKFNPHSDYARSKLEAEFELKQLATELSIELVIVRPVLVYGRNAPGNFNRLVRLVSNIPVLPFGLSNNYRSFISIDNLADFLKRCCFHPAAANQDFVISDDEDVSIKLFTTAIGKGLERNLLQLPIPISIMRLVAKLFRKEKLVEQLLGTLQIDCSKAKTLLNWHPVESMNHAMSKLK